MTKSLFKRFWIPAAYALLILLARVPGASAGVQPYEEFSGETNIPTPDSVLDALERWDLPQVKAVLDSPSSADLDPVLAVYLEARIAFLEGNYERARTVLADMLRQDPEIDVIKKMAGFVDRTLEIAQEFKTAESDHFILFYRGRDEILVDGALETLEAQYAKLSHALGIDFPEKIRTEIAPTGEAFIRLSDIPRDAVETTGTIGLCKYNKLIITSPKALPRGYEWRDTLAHELVHYFVYRRTKNHTPVWLHEGLAKYFENAWRSDSLGEMSPSQDTLLLNALKEDKIIPLKRMHPSFVYLDSAEEGAQAFAQVNTIIEYIHKKLGDGRFVVLQKVLDAITEGLEYEPAFEKALGYDFDTFYKGWIDYLKKRPMRRIARTHIEEVRFVESEEEAEKEEIDEIDSERGRELLRVGDLLRNRGRFLGAAETYAKAAEVVGLSPIIMHKQANALIKSAQNDLAQAQIQSDP
ncbi:MAG: hypothetical protein KDH09_05170, partial [Chrysiogenetes bacterium]|nr:hypothetical protein [Chrysiogenetes bacterium]